MLPFNMIIPQMGMPAPAKADGKSLLSAGLVPGLTPGLIPAKGMTQLPDLAAADEFLNLLAAQLAQIQPGAATKAGQTDQAATLPVAAQPGDVAPTAEGLKNILALLEQGGISLTHNTDGTLTLTGQNGQTLVTDLPALKALTPEALAAFLAPVLPSLPTSENAGLLTQLLAANEDSALDEATLQGLKEKLAELDLGRGKINHETLAVFKQELAETLKAQGYTPAEINRYMVALAKFLTSPETPAQPLPEGLTATELAGILTQDMQEEVPALPVGGIAANKGQAQSLLAAEPMELPVPGNRPASERSQAENAKAPALISAEGLEHDNPVERIMTMLGRNAGNERPERPTQQALSQNHSPNPLPAAVTTPPASSAPKSIALPATAAAAIAAQGEAADNTPGFGGNGLSWGNSDTGAGQHVGLAKGAETLPGIDGRGFTNFMPHSRNASGAVTQMVNIGLMRGITGKMSSLLVQLEPAELGKVEIRLKLDAKNSAARVHMTVDKPETLAMLQKDTALLERTLKEAGIETDEGSLSFDLRQQGQGFDQREAFNHLLDMQGRDGLSVANDALPGMAGAIVAQMAVSLPGTLSASGVDFMV